MDTETALALPPPQPLAQFMAAPPGVPPVPHWEHLLPDAVAQAWRRDPEVLSQLLGQLLACHLGRRNGHMDETLDELHLMVAMELQALAGFPD
ncbi:hypothetical protein Psesu_0772 [Pseudoxanthomonas suwonensis 11-1]|uniref:Uncharacterized protein n=1 Tax=Pseudoxanthomonas suwonensis (strain 11-1) TaxID=743721 RepID=E6WQV3_PSEUU|nr:hypothetical protein [Pseudoxanthomonas suwonensis]ADV26625.1 hypothetical protein Psesu_0772 [Pseudoxanthomonas suwonensis 11-1]